MIEFSNWKGHFYNKVTNGILYVYEIYNKTRHVIKQYNPSENKEIEVNEFYTWDYKLIGSRKINHF